MPQSCPGNNRVALLMRNSIIEQPNNIRDETRVVVTFLEPAPIDLRERRIDEKRAAELRARFETFAEDWDSPEMSVYDNYDVAKARL